jgi:DNA polymerase V
MTTLAQWAPAVEVYSIDEAFLDLTGIATEALCTYGQTLRTTIQQWTGIPVSIGIAPTKTLAKLANRLAKRSPHGVVVLTVTSEIEATLACTRVEDIWGIGPGYTRRLKTYDIRTAIQLRDANDRWIRQQLGVVGQRIVWELRGISCLPLELCPPPKQSLMVSRSFGRPIPGSRGCGHEWGFLLRRCTSLYHQGDLRYDGTSQKLCRRGTSWPLLTNGVSLLHTRQLC